MSISIVKILFTIIHTEHHTLKNLLFLWKKMLTNSPNLEELIASKIASDFNPGKIVLLTSRVNNELRKYLYIPSGESTNSMTILEDYHITQEWKLIDFCIEMCHMSNLLYTMKEWPTCLKELIEEQTDFFKYMRIFSRLVKMSTSEHSSNGFLYAMAVLKHFLEFVLSGRDDEYSVAYNFMNSPEKIEISFVIRNLVITLEEDKNLEKICDLEMIMNFLDDLNCYIARLES